MMVIERQERQLRSLGGFDLLCFALQIVYFTCIGLPACPEQIPTSFVTIPVPDNPHPLPSACNVEDMSRMSNETNKASVGVSYVVHVCCPYEYYDAHTYIRVLYIPHHVANMQTSMCRARRIIIIIIYSSLLAFLCQRCLGPSGLRSCQTRQQARGSSRKKEARRKRNASVRRVNSVLCLRTRTILYCRAERARGMLAHMPSARLEMQQTRVQERIQQHTASGSGLVGMAANAASQRWTSHRGFALSRVCSANVLARYSTSCSALYAHPSAMAIDVDSAIDVLRVCICTCSADQHAASLGKLTGPCRSPSPSLMAHECLSGSRVSLVRLSTLG